MKSVITAERRFVIDTLQETGKCAIITITEPERSVHNDTGK